MKPSNESPNALAGSARCPGPSSTAPRTRATDRCRTPHRGYAFLTEHRVHHVARARTGGRIPTIPDGTTGIMKRISGRPPLGRPSRKAYQ